jgi:hypothetical protein
MSATGTSGDDRKGEIYQREFVEEYPGVEVSFPSS